MNKNIVNRKGARKAEDIPPNILKLLNSGTVESVNLTEWLAVNHLKLIKSVFPKLGITKANIDLIADSIKFQKKQSTMNTTKLVGAKLYQLYSDGKEFEEILTQLSSFKSDSIRCYAPYLVALDKKLSIKEKLKKSLPLVADKHFGVREVVWMALRPEIDLNLKDSIDVLVQWTNNEDENVRRFTTESIRPRGVWCKHIDSLKENPEIALPILVNLKSDESKYVQDSVGNWLNDASKSKPEFVSKLCDKWRKESPTKETEKIIKRARRTIDKK